MYLIFSFPLPPTHLTAGTILMTMTMSASTVQQQGGVGVLQQEEEGGGGPDNLMIKRSHDRRPTIDASKVHLRTRLIGKCQ